MATQIQFRRGSTSQIATFTGANGEVVVDTVKWTMLVHDGSTAGGYEMVNTTATQTLSNKTLLSPTFTGSMTVASLNVSGTLSYVNAPTAAFTSNSIVLKSYIDTVGIIFGI